MLQGSYRVVLLRPRAQSEAFLELLLKVWTHYKNCLRELLIFQGAIQSDPWVLPTPTPTCRNISKSLPPILGREAVRDERMVHLSDLFLWVLWMEESSPVKIDPILRGSCEACPGQSVGRIEGVVPFSSRCTGTG